MMDSLRSASFGALVAVSCTVGATFQVALVIVGLFVALLSPGVFKMNNAAATSPGQAIGVLLFLLVFGLVANVTISAAGSGIWVALRNWLPKPQPPAPQTT
jgi:hypothetical protein